MTKLAGVRKGDVVRFVPLTKKRRVTILADCVIEGSQVYFVGGVRCTAAGVIDSQARQQHYPIDSTTEFEILA